MKSAFLRTRLVSALALVGTLGAPRAFADEIEGNDIVLSATPYHLTATIAEADPDLRSAYEEQIEGALELYSEMLEAGIPGEDARFVFPNATRTNLVMTANLRALMHMSGLRLGTMAQWEIRRRFQLIRHEVFAVSPFLGSFLAPKCVALGYCDEAANRDEHCPIRPHKDNVLAAWADRAGKARAGRDGPSAT